MFMVDYSKVRTATRGADMLHDRHRAVGPADVPMLRDADVRHPVFSWTYIAGNHEPGADPPGVACMLSAWDMCAAWYAMQHLVFMQRPTVYTPALGTPSMQHVHTQLPCHETSDGHGTSMQGLERLDPPGLPGASGCTTQQGKFSWQGPCGDAAPLPQRKPYKEDTVHQPHASADAAAPVQQQHNAHRAPRHAGQPRGVGTYVRVWVWAGDWLAVWAEVSGWVSRWAGGWVVGEWVGEYGWLGVRVIVGGWEVGGCGCGCRWVRVGAEVDGGCTHALQLFAWGTQTKAPASVIRI
eukprot:364283-Chlamydomonas_euryale.AAC.11